jgi:hypothetical protein
LGRVQRVDNRRNFHEIGPGSGYEINQLHWMASLLNNSSAARSLLRRELTLSIDVRVTAIKGLPICRRNT